MFNKMWCALSDVFPVCFRKDKLVMVSMEPNDSPTITDVSVKV